jgi:hypothetical protein
MPASRIEEAVRRLSPEPLLCWCNGQSLESRYSSSVTSAGSLGGGAAGAAVLRHQLGNARLEGAVPMPRFPVAALSASRIYLFDGPVPEKDAFAVLRRDQVQVVHGGNAMWRRLDLLVIQAGMPRSYTMMVSGLGGGRKRLERLIGELTGAS